MPNAHVSDVKPFYAAALGYDRPNELFAVFEEKQNGEKGKILYIGYLYSCVNCEYDGIIDILFINNFKTGFKNVINL